MNVTFTITVLFSKATPDLKVELLLLPPTGDIPAAGNIYQAYIQFEEWDVGSMPHAKLYNNIVAGLKISGYDKSWNSISLPLNVSCGLESLGNMTNKGYANVTGENIGCVNAWR